jgi:hypothetical protein
VTYISLAHHNSGIVVISDMEAFTDYFCFAKKQKQGRLVSDIQVDEEAQPSEVISEGKALEIDAALVSPDASEDDDIL